MLPDATQKSLASNKDYRAETTLLQRGYYCDALEAGGKDIIIYSISAEAINLVLLKFFFIYSS